MSVEIGESTTALVRAASIIQELSASVTMPRSPYDVPLQPHPTRGDPFTPLWMHTKLKHVASPLPGRTRSLEDYLPCHLVVTYYGPWVAIVRIRSLRLGKSDARGNW